MPIMQAWIIPDTARTRPMPTMEPLAPIPPMTAMPMVTTGAVLISNATVPQIPALAAMARIRTPWARLLRMHPVATWGVWARVVGAWAEWVEWPEGMAAWAVCKGIVPR